MDTTIADPLVGRLLDGRYLIEARVARGGMASVYRATDERLDRSVAVKVMQPVLAESEEFVRRFIREAQSAARLSHGGHRLRKFARSLIERFTHADAVCRLQH